MAQHPHRVLVVDDNSDMLLTLTALLEDEGYEVRTARDGAQALRELAAFQPRAVICDLCLPGPSGWAIARTVASEGQPPLLVAMSGEYTQASDRLMSGMSGFNYFLTKPLDPELLIAILEDELAAPQALKSA